MRSRSIRQATPLRVRGRRTSPTVGIPLIARKLVEVPLVSVKARRGRQIKAVPVLCACQLRGGQHKQAVALVALVPIGVVILLGVGSTALALGFVLVSRVLQLVALCFLGRKTLPLGLDFGSLVGPLLADDLGDLRVRHSGVLGGGFGLHVAAVHDKRFGISVSFQGKGKGEGGENTVGWPGNVGSGGDGGASAQARVLEMGHGGLLASGDPERELIHPGVGVHVGVVIRSSTVLGHAHSSLMRHVFDAMVVVVMRCVHGALVGSFLGLDMLGRW